MHWVEVTVSLSGSLLEKVSEAVMARQSENWSRGGETGKSVAQ
jgi:hypothetical protein